MNRDRYPEERRGGPIRTKRNHLHIYSTLSGNRIVFCFFLFWASASCFFVLLHYRSFIVAGVRIPSFCVALQLFNSHSNFCLLFPPNRRFHFCFSCFGLNGMNDKNKGG